MYSGGFFDFFRYPSSLHTYNTRYAASQNLNKSRVRTNTGKQTISYKASVFWYIPSYLKNLTVYQFSKQNKLLFEQLENSNILNIQFFQISTAYISWSVSLCLHFI